MLPMSAGGVATVDGECDADDETGAGAAEPEDGGGDFVGSAEPADRLVGYGVGHAEFTLGDHVGHHRCLDRSGADGVDPDAARRVLQSGAPGKADDPVL